MMWFIPLITTHVHPDDFVLLYDKENYASIFGHSEENCGWIKSPSYQKKMSGVICDPTEIQNLQKNAV